MSSSVNNSALLAEGGIYESRKKQIEDVNRIKKLKMSQYFRRQKANPVERRYMSTAHTALDHSLLNSDLETNSCAIVKLRL